MYGYSIPNSGQANVKSIFDSFCFILEKEVKNVP